MSKIQKIKDFTKGNALKIGFLTSSVVAIVANSAFADPTTGTDPGSVLSSSLSTGQTQILNGLGSVAPYAIAIVVAFLVYKYGIKFFKGLSK